MKEHVMMKLVTWRKKFQGKLRYIKTILLNGLAGTIPFTELGFGTLKIVK